MDFWIDIAKAVILKALLDRRVLRQYRTIMVEIAHAILEAYEQDNVFQKELEVKLGRVEQ